MEKNQKKNSNKNWSAKLKQNAIALFKRQQIAKPSSYASIPEPIT